MAICTTAAISQGVKYAYELFVLYDDKDRDVPNGILPLLTNENISVCTLQDDGMPGNDYFDTAFELVQQAKRILIVVSKFLCANKILRHIIKVACSDPFVEGKLIALLTDGELTRSGLFCLRHVAFIDFKCDWLADLKTELLTVIPEYSFFHTNNSTSNSALAKGILLEQITMNLYGVLITTKNKNFLIDLSEFSKHADKHLELEIAKACEACGFLADLNTTISLGFSDEFLQTQQSKFGGTQFSKGLLELMKCVMDAHNPHSKSNLWSVSCSVKGEYKPAHADYIHDMFGSVVYALLNKAASKMDVPFLPEYEDIEKRVESMQICDIDDEKREHCAYAGFVCIAEPDRMQCFQCGWHIPLSAMDIDPLLYHASYMPLCPYIQKILPQDKMPPMRVHHKDFDNSQLSTNDTGDPDFQMYAEAGFYKNGFENIIECISCGLCIIINNVGTNPWDTHALLSPTCKYLLEKKGESFVRSVNALRATEKEPTILTYALTDFSFNHRTNWPGILFSPDTI